MDNRTGMPVSPTAKSNSYSPVLRDIFLSATLVLQETNIRIAKAKRSILLVVVNNEIYKVIEAKVENNVYR